MKIAIKGFLVLFLPLSLIGAPLFFHHSETPWISTYSFEYFLMLICLITTSVGVSCVVGWSCWNKGNLLPSKFLLVLLLLCIGILIVGEIGLRFIDRQNLPFKEIDWGNRRSLIFGFDPIKNYQWTAAGATYTIDQLGFRTHVSDPFWHQSRQAGHPGDPFVFVLGGSSVFGFGLNDNETWPHLLELKIRKISPDSPATVINAGVCGFNSFQTFLRFYLRVLRHKPTHLIYYEAVNDMREDELTVEDYEEQGKVLLSSSRSEYLSVINPNKNYYMRTNLFYTIDTFITPLIWRLTHEKPSTPPEPFSLYTYNPYKKDKTILVKNGENYIRNIKLIIDVCKRNGIQLILSTFIFDNEKYPLWKTETVTYYNSLLRELAQSEGIALIDLEKDFQHKTDKTAYFFDDHYHPSRKGAEYIANSISKKMVPIMRK